ncbi:hypothetical protein ACFZ8E_01145 [Methylobacterium sp. HMF5984]|uniref:hypothetical protein n=1 Tax=Methylobacterium sp. HMF5984 TaxID=3367370 RepID=UPI003852D7BB
MDDQQLGTLGYISVIWNRIERNLAACIWVVARWEQNVGEVVTAGLGNVSQTDLLTNLIGLKNNDPKLAEQAQKTVALYQLIRGSRNDLMHGFYNSEHIGLQPAKSLTKVTSRKGGGPIELKVVPVSLEYLQQLASDMHVCNESLYDLRHKFFFRNRWIDGHRGPLENNYEDAVHGWRAPSFETSFVQEVLARRSQLLNPPRSRSQPKASQAKSRTKTPPGPQSE